MPEVLVADRAEFDRARAEPWAVDVRELGERLAPRIARRHRWRMRWSWPGECEACGTARAFGVGRGCASYTVAGRWRPVWRETLVCPECRLNCRQRFVAGRLASLAADGARVYMTERLTDSFEWARRALGAAELVGSEYLPDEASRAVVPDGVRHEDVEALSFEDASFDVVVSCEVLEHVPHPDAALAELARVLRPGGALLLTVPFDGRNAESRTRARLVDGSVEHLLEPVHHGNPVPGSDGSLVFTDFGWDLLARLQAAGFESARAQVYGSRGRGYLGGPHVLFVARRRGG